MAQSSSVRALGVGGSSSATSLGQGRLPGGGGGGGGLGGGSAGDQPGPDGRGAGAARGQFPMGAIVGSLIGVTGWAWGTLIWAAVLGDVAAVWWPCAVGMVMSLALGLMYCWIIMLGQSRRPGDAPGGLATSASLLTLLGVLMLYVSQVVEPAVQKSATLSASPTAIFFRAPDLVSLLLLLAAVILWFCVVMRWRRLGKAIDTALDVI